MNAMTCFAGMFDHQLLPTDERRIGFGNGIQIIQEKHLSPIIRFPNRPVRFDGLGLHPTISTLMM